MSPGTGSTGFVLEQMVLPSLRNGGYACESQIHIGNRPSGGKHYADVIATKANKRFLISLKWQQVSGTAEQKVPFEVICLAEAVTEQSFEKAYLVLGGEGWSLRTYFTGGGLTKHLVNPKRVSIVTLEAFIALANRGSL